MSPLRPVAVLAWAMISVALGAGLYAGYRAVPDMSPFALKSICIEGAVRTTREEVLRASGLRPGAGIFDVDADRVRSAVERLPWVRRARVARRFPSGLIVELEEWEPRCLVRLDRLYYASSEGHVIRAPLDQGLDYPVLTGLTWADLEGGGPLAGGLCELFSVLDRGVLEEEVSEIHADPEEGFTIYTPSSGGTAIRLGFSGFGEKFARLARLRRHLAKRAQAAYSVNLVDAEKIIARLLPAAPGKGVRP